MDNKEYNGWHNYATWRVKLELVDDDKLWKDNEYQSVYDFAQDIKVYVEDVLFGGNVDYPSKTLVEGYAQAFIQDVDYMEIAQHIVDDYPQIIKTQ